MYEYYRGRRDLKLYSILALSVGTAVFQAVHKLERLGVHAASSFDARVVAAICLVSVAVVFLATRIRKLPLPADLILATGGITYPLYLLHMQIGYTILAAAAPLRSVELWTATIILGTVILAWVTWRFVERSAHSWTKRKMSVLATRLGWLSGSPIPAVGSSTSTAEL
jgi:peptidoglycan/LPS O-acetylase OafA/YrhL